MSASTHALLEEASALHRAGQLAEALVLYRQVIAGDSGNYVAMNLMAVLLNQTGQTALAEKLFQHVFLLQPNYAQAHFNYAHLLAAQNRLEPAIHHYHQALAQTPDNVDTLQNLGSAYFQNQQIQQAADTWQRVLTLQPNHLQAQRCLGMALQSLGKLEEARALFESMLQQAPQMAEAHYHLSQIKEYTQEDEQFRQMLALSSQPLPDEQRSLPLFALAKACDDMKQYARAFDYYRQANESEKKRLPAYDPVLTQQKLTEIEDAFTSSCDHMRSLQGSTDETPVFIVGLPRCGSTLVEQILASHPDVTGIGETLLLAQSLDVETVRSGIPFPAFLATLDTPRLHAIADHYLGKLRSAAGQTAATRIVDKQLDNFRFVGLIALLFPKARIIHCQRNAIETCWSIFKLRFFAPRPYAYDLKALGEHYRLYERMMAFWRQWLPGRMYELSYEALIAHPEDEIAKLLAHCGLSPHPDCIRFHETRRTVSTVSNVQVRKPLYASATHASAPYAEFLEPLRQALASTDA